VYIPGYAIKGPVNEPTVVRGVSEFTSIFGSAPYRFKSDNRDEKSYIYAIELLRSGLPISFERIATEQLLTKIAKADINFYDARYNGTSTQTQVSSQILTAITTYPYSVTISHLFTEGSLRIMVGDTLVEDDGLGSLLVGDTTVGTVNYLTGQLEITDNVVGTGTPSATYTLLTPIVWAIQGTLSNNVLVWAVTGNGDTYVNAEVTLSTTVAHVVVTNLYTADINVVKSQGTLSTGTYIEISAKYPGAYGNDIKVSFNYSATDDLTEDKLYELIVKFEGVTYSNYVSLDYESDRYIGKLVHSIVDIDFEIDPAYINLDLFYVSETNKSLVIVIEEDEMTVAGIISELKRTDEDSIYSKLEDKTVYNVKFITSGAYPAIDGAQDITIARNILRCAANRTDALGFIDLDISIEPQEVLDIVKLPALYATSNTQEDIRKYGTIIYPSGQYYLQTIGTTEEMLGSFGYFKALAVSQRSNPNWFAIAGVNRGLIPDLVRPTYKITGSLSELWQKETGFSVNPILYIRPYGHCIWGNRTLNPNVEGLVASSFTNIRVLSCDIKKIVVDAATRLTYEINDDVLWNTFKSVIEPTLDQMVTGRGIRDYKLIRLPDTKRATVNGLIRIVPIEAVENFDITFTLEDNLAVVQ
jgi:hypothetical protein